MTFFLEFYTSLVCTFILIIGWSYWSWWNYVSQKGQFYKKIKSPPGLPILGNALEMQNLKTLLDVLLKYKQNYGDIVKVNVGPIRKLIVVADYKLLEFLLSSQKILNKSAEYEFFHSWLGTGLLTSEGTKWKKRRRIITPAFHFKILEEFIDIFEANGNILMKKFEENASDNVDIYPLVALYALDVICETAMGASVNAQNNSHSPYVLSVKEMCRLIMERTVSPIEMNHFLYKFTKNYSTEKEALHVLHEFTRNVIKQRKNEKQQLNNKTDDEENIGTKRKQAFLDLLLDATIDNRPLTDEEIREEVDTFMFEGHDTTASAISFTLYCLANHPDVQKRVYQEQNEIFGDSSPNVVNYQDFSEMKYLEQVIRESLRLYPSVPIYGRETDQELQFDDLKIPKGVTFMLFVYGIQRDAKYFPNPNEFNPSRFDHIDGKLPFSYLPFSAGPRNCIGQKFAMLEMKSTVSKIIRNFVLLPAIPEHKLELTAETILKPANGLRIGLNKRQ